MDPIFRITAFKNKKSGVEKGRLVGEDLYMYSWKKKDVFSTMFIVTKKHSILDTSKVVLDSQETFQNLPITKLMIGESSPIWYIDNNRSFDDYFRIILL